MIDTWYLDNLVCPRDYTALELGQACLTCKNGHAYPVIDGMPVMLLDDVEATASFCEGSLQRANTISSADQRAPDLYLESLGISELEKRSVIAQWNDKHSIDPVAAHLVAATNGLMYRHLVGTLDRYPIPKIELPSPAKESLLLDVGCSWGRWTLAAHAKGYNAVGIDPSLGAVMAARRIAKQLDVPIHYIVGDARHLPFRFQSVDVVYSYSVLQHLSHDNANKSVAEIVRVLKQDGKIKVQMPNVWGLRCLYHQARRGFRAPKGFDVRYRSVRDLKKLFEKVGRTLNVSADCFFGIGLQRSDAMLMPLPLNVVLQCSEILKWVSRRFPLLVQCADSVFIETLEN